MGTEHDGDEQLGQRIGEHNMFSAPPEATTTPKLTPVLGRVIEGRPDG